MMRWPDHQAAVLTHHGGHFGVLFISSLNGGGIIELLRIKMEVVMHSL